MNTVDSLRAALVAVAAALGTLAGCDRKAETASNAEMPAAPVRVAPAERRDLPLEIRTIGTAESLAVVSVRPQVAGKIIEIPIAEGQEVNEGDVLVRLDPRPFEAELSEAEARTEASRAREKDAKLALAQMEAAVKGRAVSERERDKAQADAEWSAAEVRMNEASVQTARLHLEYCTIPSPITGRVGKVPVKAGNVVKENETEVMQIAQVVPIGVSFAVPEHHLAEIRRLQIQGPLLVEAVAPGDDGAPAKGEISFIDNQVDPDTGTIRLRGTFDNADRRLWPGQFVRVTLRLTVEKDVIVIPAYAVQTGQQGSFVFVVQDGAAQMRTVRVARTEDGMAAISSGLEAGDSVVTDGHLRLLPGGRVRVLADAAPGA